VNVWERNGIWYYQFRYRGRQYSGRAWEAKSIAEAKEAEEQHRAQVAQPFTTTQGYTEVEGHEATSTTGNDSKVNIIVDETLLTRLLEGKVTQGARTGEEEITHRERSAINWQSIIEVAAGVFIGQALYGIVSILAISRINF
jgi:hypothetical protein